MNENTPATTSRIASALGYGGLVPFVALAVLTGVDHEREVFWHATLRNYGALILSFVGALHWGFAMTLGNLSSSKRHSMFTWSVVPCLVAFVSLALQSVLGDILLMAGFLTHYWQDRRLVAIAPLPAWYLPLRLRLSAVAIVCLAVGAALNQ